MPFKIYTYEDPYKLDQTDFWNEICVLPHFCSARTLVNGLKDLYEDKIRGLICAFDDLIQHEHVYQSWTGNISQQVGQYSQLTALFQQLKGKKIGDTVIDDSFLWALAQNQKHFLEALRLFIELGISAASIDGSKGNAEQKLFVFLLSRLQNQDIFKFPEAPDIRSLHQVLIDLAEKEIQECRGPKREVIRCERALALVKKQPFTSMVVHGIHQFTPVQLRLLLDLDRQGITIIFLFNYQKKYSRIYSSWNDIYRCFEVPFRHDTAVPEYQMPTMPNPSYALACALGEICENRNGGRKDRLARWHRLYQNIPFREFANITEYAHFVSNHVVEAKHTCYEKESIQLRGSLALDNAKVLREMTEQVYTANKDIHTLLRIYHPEFSHDRHFLAYPIGQFFSAIYRLWDYEKHSIRIDIPDIRECLSSKILKSASGETLLRTFYTLEILFEHITTYAEFRSEIAGKYLQNYRSINSASGNPDLQSLGIYNRHKVPEKDILDLIQAIDELNEIAQYLFEQGSGRQNYIEFGSHFHNLEEFLKQRELSLATSKERELIRALQLRLDQIHPERSRFSGTFRDLREGLHFYLKQKESEEPAVDWIVKNFEQIDGDILQSKHQFEREQIKTYHFGCISDRDMNLTVNDLLPWPLTDEFIRAAYTPADLQFQVYYTALGERSRFLRYALFYGLCFNRCNVRLSYVKQYGDEETEPYTLLSILGFHNPVSEPVEALGMGVPIALSISQEKKLSIPYDPFQMMDLYLCPYRFFLDYVTENAPIMEGDFLFQKLFENLLIEGVWKKIEKEPCNDAKKQLNRLVYEEAEHLKPYFSFWQAIEITDLKLRAYNYLAHEIIGKSRDGVVTAYDRTHMKIRKLFGLAKYGIDISETEPKNPYETFESLTRVAKSEKIYSLHSIPARPSRIDKQHLIQNLRQEAERYINQNEVAGKTAIPSDWCKYCTHRGMCMEAFSMQ